MWKIILFLSMYNFEIADDRLVAICKKPNNLVFDYMDSRGISSINKVIEGDTLKLTIFVSLTAKQHGENVDLPANIRYVVYGKTIKNIDKIDTCHRVYSGQEAVDFLNKQRN